MSLTLEQQKKLQRSAMLVQAIRLELLNPVLSLLQAGVDLNFKHCGLTIPEFAASILKKSESQGALFGTNMRTICGWIQLASEGVDNLNYFVKRWNFRAVDFPRVEGFTKRLLADEQSHDSMATLISDTHSRNFTGIDETTKSKCKKTIEAQEKIQRSEMLVHAMRLGLLNHAAALLQTKVDFSHTYGGLTLPELANKIIATLDNSPLIFASHVRNASLMVLLAYQGVEDLNYFIKMWGGALLDPKKGKDFFNKLQSDSTKIDDMDEVKEVGSTNASGTRSTAHSPKAITMQLEQQKVKAVVDKAIENISTSKHTPTVAFPRQ